MKTKRIDKAQAVVDKLVSNRAMWVGKRDTAAQELETLEAEAGERIISGNDKVVTALQELRTFVEVADSALVAFDKKIDEAQRDVQAAQAADFDAQAADYRAQADTVDAKAKPYLDALRDLQGASYAPEPPQPPEVRAVTGEMRVTVSKTPLSDRLRSEANACDSQAASIRANLAVETPKERAERERKGRAEVGLRSRRVALQERLDDAKRRGHKSVAMAPGVAVDTEQGFTEEQERQILEFEARR